MEKKFQVLLKVCSWKVFKFQVVLVSSSNSVNQ